MMALHRDTTFTYLGHATLLVETPGGKRILIDPFLTHNPKCPAEYKDVTALGNIDVILLTHIHGDHASDAATVAQANPEAVTICVPEVAHWLSGKGVKKISAMNKGGSQTQYGIRITMTHADHTSSIEENGVQIYGGEPVGYVVKVENGFTFYAAGDTAIFGDMALIAEIYRPELALLPIGDHYTMGPLEAAYAVRLLKVEHILPIHYATFPVLTGTPDALKDHLSDLPNVRIHALAPGESLK